MSNTTRNASGMVTLDSPWPFPATVERLCTAITAAGYHVFARVDHAANAAQAGLALRPTELVLLGNPRSGTELMLDQQQVGLDLPSKILVWQDDQDTVRLTYNTAAWLTQRHTLRESGSQAAVALETALAQVCDQVIQPDDQHQ
ncbi:DUF302 domain-containing protein [Streptomyces sp. NPDC002809]|uniref:DUF302 domain-containing protein n=1 Tax=Streptomyces sp. NPDC002809 TaxID=3154433 RepID=UPI00332056C9